jgi:glycosyltransferase involved in cell wall biosynthesis
MPILAGAAAVAALAWAYLLAAHGGYWRTDQRLPPGARDASRDPARWPSVVAVVPARDEAAILPVTLPSLLGQDYPGEFSVVLVDDASTDGTAAAAADLAAGTGRRLLVTAAGGPPPGWAGKVHAMARGLRAAGDCDYVLFTDADIGYAPDALATLVRGAVADDRGLVSQMALLRAESGWERVIVPAFCPDRGRGRGLHAGPP